MRLFVFPWSRLPCIFPFPVCTNVPCVPHDIVFPIMSHADVAESECFPLGAPLHAVVPVAFSAESNVSSRWRETTMESKCELIQPLLSEQRRELIQPHLSEHRWYRCFIVGTCELRRLLLSEQRRLRCCNNKYRGKCALGWSGNGGTREQRALAGLSAAAHVPSSGSTMTGPACSFFSSSDAPVCASLIWAASAKSSPLMHAGTDDRAMTEFIEKRVKDNHLRSVASFFVALRPPVSRLTQATNVQIGSMLPASASFGLSRVSQGRYRRKRGKFVACEARGDTCRRGAALGRHSWERQSVCWQRLWTASLHFHRKFMQSFFCVGGGVN